VLAREAFLRGLGRLGETYGIQAHKGASEQVKASAIELIKKAGPSVLLKTSKCHFRTTDQVLAACGSSRAALGPEGQAVSRTKDGE
jgi:ribonuclease HIII